MLADIVSRFRLRSLSADSICSTRAWTVMTSDAFRLEPIDAQHPHISFAACDGLALWNDSASPPLWFPAVVHTAASVFELPVYCR